MMGRDRAVGRSQPKRASATATAATVGQAKRPRDRRGPPAARGTAAVSTVNAGLVSASANSSAVPNRSAGSFSSALASAAATFGGTDLRNFVTAVASSVTIFMMICCAVEPVCGGSPASIS